MLSVLQTTKKGKAKRRILRLYRDDVSKFAAGYEEKVYAAVSQGANLFMVSISQCSIKFFTFPFSLFTEKGLAGGANAAGYVAGMLWCGKTVGAFTGEAGSGEVTYFFGVNGEKMIDKVCCSDYPSSLFDTARELGAVTMFCGHDHYNNLSVEYEGVRLTYGMSIDYLAMPGIEKDTEQRGGELITIRPDGSWDLEQIPLTSITVGD